MKTLTPKHKAKKTNGFGNQTIEVEYQHYFMEFKKRFLTDNSELLIGTAKVKVPKYLRDLTGQTLTKREVWDAFACAVSYCILSSRIADEKGVNQIFVFDNQARLIHRIELNDWNEKGSTSEYKTVMSEEQSNIAFKSVQFCEIDFDWLETPVPT